MFDIVNPLIETSEDKVLVGKKFPPFNCSSEAIVPSLVRKVNRLVNILNCTVLESQMSFILLVGGTFEAEVPWICLSEVIFDINRLQCLKEVNFFKKIAFNRLFNLKIFIIWMLCAPMIHKLMKWKTYFPSKLKFSQNRLTFYFSAH